jgi:hypothetical protein
LLSRVVVFNNNSVDIVNVSDDNHPVVVGHYDSNKRSSNEFIQRWIDGFFPDVAISDDHSTRDDHQQHIGNFITNVVI